MPAKFVKGDKVRIIGYSMTGKVLGGWKTRHDTYAYQIAMDDGEGILSILEKSLQGPL